MTKQENEERDARGPAADPSRGPDESGVGAQSHSSPQGDGAERGATRGGRRDVAGSSPAEEQGPADQRIGADEA